MIKFSKKITAISAIIIFFAMSEFMFADISNFAVKSLKNIEIPEIFSFNKNLSDFLEIKRGGSFGGRRGGSATRSRSSSSSSSSATRSSSTSRSSSFGGSRTMTSQQARAKYGTPRKTETRTMTGANGAPMNYNVHHYGGFSSGLMTGYMTGQMMWYMTVPAFFYSRPVYVKNADGTTDVYPPTFNWSKLFFILLIIAAIYYLVKRARNKNRTATDNYSSSSFG